MVPDKITLTGEQCLRSYVTLSYCKLDKFHRPSHYTPSIRAEPSTKITPKEFTLVPPLKKSNGDVRGVRGAAMKTQH